MFFIIFLFSGIFKLSLNFPIDITILFFGLTLLGTLKRFIQKPLIPKWWFIPLGFITSLMVIVLLSIILHPTDSASISKLTDFILLTIPTIVLPLIFIQDKSSLKRLLASIALLSTVLSVFALPQVWSGEGLFIGFNEGNYMGLARLTGLGFIALLYFFINSKSKSKHLILIPTLIVAVVLLSTGSRMPLIALAIASLYLLSKVFIYDDRSIYIRKKAIYIVFTIIALATILYILLMNGYFKTFLFRFEVLFEDGVSSSSQGRTNRYEAALDMWNQNFILGGGFGSFGKYYEGSGIANYAHNIVLEFLSELGLLGGLWLIIFLAFIIISAYKGIKNGDVTLNTTIFIMFIYFFLNALISGNINDNRALFMFGIMVIAALYKSRVYRKEYVNNNLIITT